MARRNCRTFVLAAHCSGNLSRVRASLSFVHHIFVPDGADDHCGSTESAGNGERKPYQAFQHAYLAGRCANRPQGAPSWRETPLS